MSNIQTFLEYRVTKLEEELSKVRSRLWWVAGAVVTALLTVAANVLSSVIAG